MLVYGSVFWCNLIKDTSGFKCAEWLCSHLQGLVPDVHFGMTGVTMSTHMVCILFNELIAQLGLAWDFQPRTRKLYHPTKF